MVGTEGTLCLLARSDLDGDGAVVVYQTQCTEGANVVEDDDGHRSLDCIGPATCSELICGREYDTGHCSP